ncbi:hypothetical protein A2422_01760 [Candidatus Woesebacteria bacterium RIFOXYC1_FULL_31_51]|uniref:Uncharacterized protein n=1 Tax=Candidatus Woesebacteria bacterium GW2011_GWC2_31_9 TaxID=1618586 RepID=A0A0G0BLJ6_9BACT|nr:MAG: hypothetical protein UR17_C0001G0808 [Candidatus Woesebacteria bacterium GW2011_GWF1_31_35]KKP23647.1 MAG: hypothetical protein UR11_C0001G0621 [Candidatus Woesebacteria bacterium GW2011_GWC1_30_29]KKP26972.1 MAG: hypothetical protein UR13_C0001G0067 [Candidatus Woesebacteria bacterium GW2011_GWD1_31_12]KKP27922.1 MAG: hypothetical protein UR16_C0002G0252 [Candidatus Woesebacteria bacterium GW2011_GWB1_31_29]KKP31861.1 MAG: hypothetical protein UR20_C0031G0004 [Candidatus Woesebacteria 
MVESETIKKQWYLKNNEKGSELHLVDLQNKILQRVFKSVGEDYTVNLDDQGNILAIVGTSDQLLEAEIEIEGRLKNIKIFLEKRCK